MRGSLLRHSQFETGCLAHAAQEQKAGLHSSGSGVQAFGVMLDAKQSSQSSIPHFPASRFSQRVLQSPVSSPFTGKAGSVVSQRASRSHNTSQASSGVTDAGVGWLGAGLLGAGSAGAGPNRMSPSSVFAGLVLAGSSTGAVSTIFPPQPRTKRSNIVARITLPWPRRKGSVVRSHARAMRARSSLTKWRPRQDSNLPPPV